VSVFTYDELMAGMMAQGVPRDLADRSARQTLRDCGLPMGATGEDLGAEDRARVLEKQEQSEIVKQFRAYSFVVYNLSQARAAKQTPGLPDLWIAHTRLALAGWWESKRPVGGSLSSAQRDFREQCIRCSVSYGTGDRRAAALWLIEQGLARAGPGPNGIVPIGEDSAPLHRSVV
jgi:hypothetical protein